MPITNLVHGVSIDRLSIKPAYTTLYILYRGTYIIDLSIYSIIHKEY